jgi:hypothetical protein
MILPALSMLADMIYQLHHCRRWLEYMLSRCNHMTQADTVIMTNQNQRSEAPQEIIQDIITGFPDEILDNNARKPWAGGFLQDPCRVSHTVREFLFYHQNVYDSQASLL